MTGSDTATVSITALPDLTIDKDNGDADDTIILGDSFTWTFTITNSVSTNTANFTDTERILLDDLPVGPAYGVVSVSNFSGVTGSVNISCAIAAGTLTCQASGGAVSIDSGGSFEVSFLVTPASAGVLNNPNAMVDPDDEITEGDEGNNTDSDSITVTDYAVTLNKTGTLNDDDGTPGVSAGDSIAYDFVVTNSGAVGLTNVSITDPLLPAPAISCPSGNPIPTLATGASETCTASYLVTQADIDAGQRDNTATVDSAEGATDSDSESIPLAQNPGIGLIKNSTTASVTAIGQIVPYQYTITNTGNVTLTGVTLQDPTTDAPPNCPDITIPVGSFMECTAQHTVTAAEFNGGGSLDNTAEANSNEAGPVQQTFSIPIIRIFDPPIGIKTYNDAGIPVLRWTMVWINDSDDPAMEAEVYDPIPAGTTYYAPDGVACTPDGSITTTTDCFYDAGNDQIVWRGTLGPDRGATSRATANNEIVIEFSVRVPDDVFSAQNNATIDADITGDDIIDPGAGEVRVASAQARWSRDLDMPETGFAPGVVTEIPGQTREQEYQRFSSVWLEIPALEINTRIVGVPAAGETWNTTWLHDKAGWLNGTAFPSYNGNSVVTGHVYLPSGLPGPFVNLDQLRWNDEIIVHAFGEQYIFQVRSNKIVLPDDPETTTHEEYPWITLVTCRGFNEVTGKYNYRVRVRAVLVETKPDSFR